MKQTAIEWLIEQISSSKYFYNLMKDIQSRSTIVQPNIFDQAKEMEKKQIIDTYWASYKEGQYSTDKTADEYYKETFKQD